MGCKHEIISCERCGADMECKANNFSRCDCTTVPISINEAQFISERYESCLCVRCLLDLKHDYLHSISDETDSEIVVTR